MTSTPDTDTRTVEQRLDSLDTKQKIVFEYVLKKFEQIDADQKAVAESIGHIVDASHAAFNIVDENQDKITGTFNKNIADTVALLDFHVRKSAEERQERDERLADFEKRSHEVATLIDEKFAAVVGIFKLVSEEFKKIGARIDEIEERVTELEGEGADDEFENAPGANGVETEAAALVIIPTLVRPDTTGFSGAKALDVVNTTMANNVYVLVEHGVIGLQNGDRLVEFLLEDEAPLSDIEDLLVEDTTGTEEIENFYRTGQFPNIDPDDEGAVIRAVLTMWLFETAIAEGKDLFEAAIAA